MIELMKAELYPIRTNKSYALTDSAEALLFSSVVCCTRCHCHYVLHHSCWPYRILFTLYTMVNGEFMYSEGCIGLFGICVVLTRYISTPHFQLNRCSLNVFFMNFFPIQHSAKERETLTSHLE